MAAVKLVDEASASFPVRCEEQNTQQLDGPTTLVGDLTTANNCCDCTLLQQDPATCTVPIQQAVNASKPTALLTNGL